MLVDLIKIKTIQLHKKYRNLCYRCQVSRN